MKQIFTITSILLAISPLAQAPSKAEPEAFKLSKKLVGGVWRGKVGELPVAIRYRLNAEKTVIEGEGTVGDPKKPVLKMTTKIGIDPIDNSVFYLDGHNGTTNYFGRCTMEGKSIVFDFTALTGDKGHWHNKSSMPDDYTLESTLYAVGDDGTEKLVHPLTLKRTRN